MNTDYMVDATTCPHCHCEAGVNKDDNGYWVTCTACGRSTSEQYDTIQEAKAAFQDEERCFYE